MPQLSILTPLGDLTLSEEDGAIVALDWGRGRDREETPLRRRVWEALRRIPAGETRSYLDIAREVGCVAARAIGGANAANPIPILIPCHRVVAADGSLGGFSAA